MNSVSRYSINSIKNCLAQVGHKIKNKDLPGAISYLHAKVPRPIVNRVHRTIYEIEKEAGRPTGHPDFGKVAFRADKGFAVTDEVRLMAIEKVQALLPRLVPPVVNPANFGSRLDDGIEREFTKLDTRDQVKRDANLSAIFARQTNICRQKENGPLNGFENVKIFDATLVPLSTGRYINANFITVQGREFIGTQAPLKNSVEDFWQMVVEQKSQSIVSLNDCFDDEKAVLAYCPSVVGEKKKFGDITIELKEPIILESNPDWSLLGSDEIETHGFKHRKLRITMGDQVHEVDHFQYLNWRDGYIPSLPCVQRLIEKVSAVQKESKSPIVVHCRAGVGRTGLFIVLYDLQMRLKQGMPLDVKRDVIDLRDPLTGRSPAMMQNLSQYQFAYDFISNSVPVVA